MSCRAGNLNEVGASISQPELVQIEIIVCNTGCGIPCDKLHSMFIDFEQADLEPRTVSGMGAHISRAWECFALLTLIDDAGFGIGCCSPDHKTDRWRPASKI